MPTHNLHISEINTFVGKFVKTLKGGEVIALIGDLGSGKTTFTKALAKSLGVKKPITSPTYILLQEFKGILPLKKKPVTLYHLDLYRTNSFVECEHLGLTEFWETPKTLTIIEWADKIFEHLPKKAIIIHLS